VLLYDYKIAGQNVASPTETPFTSLHDVFACFATPSVMWKPMEVAFDSGEKLTDSLKTAFDNPVSKVSILQWFRT
jgi:RCC1 and BTB domain-containing protein